MCEFLSAIVKRDGEVLYRPEVDSHEMLVESFELSDGGLGQFVRVEFVPAQPRKLDEPDAYVLKVDGEECPAWFEDYRLKTTNYQRDKIRGMIISGERKILIGGCHILSGAKIERVCGARIISMKDSSIREMRENSSVGEMWENGKIINDNRVKK